MPWFRGRRMTKITTADVNAYVQRRQEKGAAAATINRELAILKRAFTLAIRAGKLLPAHRPYIAMLREHNVRTGFFEADQFAAVQGQLRPVLRPVAEFAYLTGWRVHSEVLPLEWRHVDLKAGTVSLDVGSTKNGEGRTIYLRGLADAPGGAEGRRRGAGEGAGENHPAGVPSARQANPRVLQGMAERLREGGLSWEAPARFPADGRPELRPGRHPRTGGYVDERTQDRTSSARTTCNPRRRSSIRPRRGQSQGQSRPARPSRRSRRCRSD